LEAENARLKRLLAERGLDISLLKQINAKKWCARRRGAVRGS
jgi:putative transposase